MLVALIALVSSSTPVIDPESLVGKWVGLIDYPAWLAADVASAEAAFDTSLPLLRATVTISPAVRGFRTFAMSNIEPTDKVEGNNQIVYSLTLTQAGVVGSCGPIHIYESEAQRAALAGDTPGPYGIQVLEPGAITYRLRRKWPEQDHPAIRALVLQFRPVDPNAFVMHVFAPEYDNRLMFSFYLHRAE